MSISRREFLETTALGGLAVNAMMGAQVDAKTGMPTRILGRTGARVSILGFGAGSRFLAYQDEEKGLAALNRALDLGVTYVDSAYAYGDGQSETWVGKVMKTRRKEVWLVTKIPDRKGDDAMRRIEGSLKRLQTDHVDCIHMHALVTAEELKVAEAPDGIINLLYKLRDQKVCRAIGVTCHADPAVLKDALEHNDLDCTQMALNAAKVGNVFGAEAAGFTSSFEEYALPVALKKKMGITAMKLFAQEKLNGKAPAEKLISYALSLPEAAAMVGMPRMEHLEENIRIAKSFQPLSRQEMNDLNGKMLPLKASIDRFFMNHVDC